MLSKKQIKELKDNGCIKIDNFLNSGELFYLKNIIEYYSAPKSSRNSYWPTKKYQLFLKLLKFDFLKIKHSLNLLKFEKNKGLKNYAELALETKCYLNFIDAYVSKKSSLNIIPWHTDQAYDGESKPKEFVNPNKYFIKVFIYLTDVSSKNGCMSYIPGSHKIGFAVRKGIYNKEIKYKPYWNLKDMRKIVIENKNYLIKFFDNQDYYVNKFLEKTNFIESENDTEEFDHNVKAGGALIFDEGGSHRGSSPTQNDRMVLRYMYSAFKN